jgi:Leucine Rich repeat
MNSKSLKMLNISGNGLTDQGLRILLKGVEDHPSLNDLRIGFNEITPLGATSNHLFFKIDLTRFRLDRNVTTYFNHLLGHKQKHY